MIANLASAVIRLASGSYTVTRKGTPTITLGRLVPGSTSTFTITASIQPTSGRDLERLPEGLRTKETYWCYTPTALISGDANGPDTIALEGATYQVESVERWAALGNYYRCLLAKAD